MRDGTEVDTPLGVGVIVGRDPHFNEYRYIVKIKDWSKKWAFAESSDPCFWPFEVTPTSQT